MSIGLTKCIQHRLTSFLTKLTTNSKNANYLFSSSFISHTKYQRSFKVQFDNLFYEKHCNGFILVFCLRFVPFRNGQNSFQFIFNPLVIGLIAMKAIFVNSAMIDANQD